MHKNAIKLEILWVGGKYYPKKGPKLANFPRFWAKNLANLAINCTKIGDFWPKSSGNTAVGRARRASLAKILQKLSQFFMKFSSFSSKQRIYYFVSEAVVLWSEVDILTNGLFWALRTYQSWWLWYFEVWTWILSISSALPRSLISIQSLSWIISWIIERNDFRPKK